MLKLYQNFHKEQAMKESEKLRRQLTATCIAGILACLYSAFMTIMAIMTTLWIGAINIIIVPIIIWIVADIPRCMKKIHFWRWLESEDREHLPAGLKQKYLLYEAALQNVEGYKKDVARMEERAQSIKVEIEAEFGGKQ